MKILTFVAKNNISQNFFDPSPPLTFSLTLTLPQDNWPGSCMDIYQCGSDPWVLLEGFDALLNLLSFPQVTQTLLQGGLPDDAELEQLGVDVLAG